MITEKEYYDLMYNFSNKSMSFEDIHDKWYKCFDYFLRRLKIGYNKKIIDSLFYDFDMENWNAMHQENTEYRGLSKEELIGEFAGEAHYISDRMSYDRLFRTHWLFKQAFYNELSRIKYPSLYE